ncbi:tyrosine-type recombinase/integrase [Enterobacter cloacae]|uniref:tyrosine-type recombinase/integrase n=1 Tax=Enterobacter cloacae TaxID=550 RepID=UPI002B203B05|nr:tyrosine-type recombinase/integrase [Enterobacter cloacae]MEA5215294.1 tyrosine-type recombinase/integrase [Enterobacter cloacae]
MASIKHLAGAKGVSRYFVHWRDERTGNGRRRILKNIDDAAYLFWQKQNIELDCRTASWSGIDSSWNLQKLLMYFLGYQFNKVETNQIQLSSYKKCRHDILAISGDILGRNILSITHYDIAKSVRAGCHRWLRSAYFLLLEKKLISFNPVKKTVKRKRKPITIPSKATVRQLLDVAPLRERIACWLGICGLRIGEVLAVTYSDVSEDWIHIRRHVVDGVICDGLKRGVERRVRMPRELFDLLDKSRIGTKYPLVANQFTGGPLSTCYGTQGPLFNSLQAFDIRCFHHLRHFAVSRLAEKGVDIMKISRLIGHSSIRITIDVYGHLFNESVDMDLD